MRDLVIVGAAGLGRDIIDTVMAIDDQTPTSPTSLAGSSTQQYRGR